MRSNYDALLAAYRDALVRIGEQGENFDRSEAIDTLSRIADSTDIRDTEQREMMVILIRAAASFELDDDAKREIDLCTSYLNGDGAND